MVRQNWLLALLESLSGPARTRVHRLRPKSTASAVRVLETRLYLGALPGVDAAIWTEPAETAPEPAIIDLIAADDSSTTPVRLDTQSTAMTPPDATSESEEFSTTSIKSDVDATDVDDAIMMTMLSSSLEEPVEDDTVMVQTGVVDDPADNVRSLDGASREILDSPQNELPPNVDDPAEGGAQSGSVPVGIGGPPAATLSTGTGSTVMNFGGITREQLVDAINQQPIVVKYDFRGVDGKPSVMTTDQQAAAEDALHDWTEALSGAVQFQRDTEAPADQILTIGMGDLAALKFQSAAGGTLALGGGTMSYNDAGEPVLQGVIWLDQDETWDSVRGNGNVAGAVDVYSVVSHEIGHVLGLEDSGVLDAGAMNDQYSGERSIEAIRETVAWAGLSNDAPWRDLDGYSVDPSGMVMSSAQITQSEVQQLLATASSATASQDGIIAIVDRNGRILGVRVEQEVLDTITDPATLVFAIDGAVAKARTAAFFANGDPNNTDSYSPQGTVGPLTSRTVRFISQSTMTQREVQSNPNIMDPNSPDRGPGYVAPIGIGGHFPPEIANTPPVDLFAIEHTNRDSVLDPGIDNIRGTPDDYLLRGRFNIDPTYVDPGQQLYAPESYGYVTGILPSAQSRGIATLPGGIPLYRDTNMDGFGDTVVGGVGVFFPGETGDATFEQNFIPGIGQTEEQRTNAPKVLEAEFIALITAGGSTGAVMAGAPEAKPDPSSTFDLPFGRIDLVGIQLQIVGPTAGIVGVNQLIDYGQSLGTGVSSGMDQPIDAGADMLPGTGDEALYADGLPVPEGWLVNPHDSADGSITAADVEQIINQGIDAAERVRAAIRLSVFSDGSSRPGARTRMTFCVTDKNGEILGLYRMKDGTVFSIDVAVAKARNTAYYADATVLQPQDRVPGIAPGTAFTNRTFRFLAEPRYPAGVENYSPPPFSILNAPGIDPLTGENTGAALPASVYNGTVLGYDSFNPMTNFHDPGDPAVVATPTPNDTSRANQNGVVFFPGSTPLYDNNTTLVGGFGVSGDGVDQDDVVTFLGSEQFLPDGQTVLRADQVEYGRVNLVYMKFNRNPFA